VVCSVIYQEAATIDALSLFFLSLADFLTRRFLRTSENSRYAKFVRISGSFPKCPGKGPIRRVNLTNVAGHTRTRQVPPKP
jgi:hypothetical protein